MGVQIVKLLGNPVTLSFTGGVTPKGAYVAETTYATGESVSYNGSSYVAIQETTGNLPTDTTYWQVLASKGSDGANGADSTVPGPKGDQGDPGAAGQGVAIGGTTGQVLKKKSNTNYDTEWGTVSGSGDVVGPSSAVDSNFAGFDTTTGKLLKDSGSKATDFATVGHNHTGTYEPADATLQSSKHTHANSVALAEVSGTNTGDQDISGKVDKVTGKGLSTNDLTDALKTAYDGAVTAEHSHSNKATLDNITAAYTSAEATKLSGIATGAEVNVQPDWNQATNTEDDYIKNKPTLGTAAAKNIPATGDASATEVVYGSDTRLTNARTPASHGNEKHSATYITAADAEAAGAVSTHAALTTGVHGVGAGTIAKTADITATKLDDFATPDNNTDLNANTTNHGLLLQATAPASGLLNVVGIANGETVYANKALFDATAPSTQAFGDAAAVGTAMAAARRDHKHAMMAAPTTVSGNAGTATTLQTARNINGVSFNGSADITVPTLPLTEAPGSDHTYTGIYVVMTAGEDLAQSDGVYFKSDGKVYKADANGASMYPCIGLATAAIATNATGTILLLGIMRDDTWNWTVGGMIYLSTTAGSFTQTQPSATDDVIQVVGLATHADRMYFNPVLTYVTHT